jgi:ubiquinone/menaquinone biosynthesis C-methylase UbiE
LVKNFKNLKKKKKIIDDYNLSAHYYDKRYKSIQEGKYQIGLDNSDLDRKKILDVGTGSGLFFESILNYKNNKLLLNFIYVAIDISWNMLLNFKEKFLNTKENMNPMLILSDIENLPLRENIFDLIFSFTSFQNLPNINKGITESFRVSISNAIFKFSILKKKLDLKKLLDFLKPVTIDLKIVNDNKLEDVIIKGKVLQNQ